MQSVDLYQGLNNVSMALGLFVFCLLIFLICAGMTIYEFRRFVKEMKGEEK